ncbi:hypothetical protein V8G54_014474 [Vigna mungo]|uniref:Uncharacterized protein n=1 Tax=Vigna mungo TaxID=3915 RepID=A0AAQ3NGQ9_VIGMU
MDRHPVLVRPLELHNVVLPRQMLHDMNLPLHILPVRLRHQLPLQNRLARVRHSCGILRAQIRHPELPSSQFLPQSVVLLYILKGFAQNRGVGFLHRPRILGRRKIGFWCTRYHLRRSLWFGRR